MTLLFMFQSAFSHFAGQLSLKITNLNLLALLFDLEHFSLLFVLI